MSKKYVILLGIVIILLGAYFIWNMVMQSGPALGPYPQGAASGTVTVTQSSPAPAPRIQVSNGSPAAPAGAASGTVTVTLTAGGFVPSSVTVKKGERVMWVNQTSAGMWVASGVHPAHTVYSGTSLSEHCPDTAGIAFDECGAVNAYTFVFQKIGMWRYHNHMDAGETGTVVVTE